MVIIETEILIQTSKENLWDILTNFQNYPTWNPVIPSIKGQLKIRNRLRIKINFQKFTLGLNVKVTSFKKYQYFSWVGSFGIFGFIDGHHSFSISPQNDHWVKFSQTEKFSGILVPLVKHILIKKISLEFEKMNYSLKSFAEHESIN